MAKQLYDYWFVQFDFPDENGKPYKSSGGKMVWNEKLKREVPEGWNDVILNDFLIIKNGRDHKLLATGNYPVYGSGGEMRRVSAYLYNGEAILMPRKGSLNNIMYVNRAFWTVDTMFYSEMKIPHCAKYVFFAIKDIDFTRWDSGTGVPSMTASLLYSIPLVKPNDIILQTFDNVLFPIFQKLEKVQLENEHLTKLRDSLLPLLMNGQVSVNYDLESLVSQLHDVEKAIFANHRGRQVTKFVYICASETCARERYWNFAEKAAHFLSKIVRFSAQVVELSPPLGAEPLPPQPRAPNLRPSRHLTTQQPAAHALLITWGTRHYRKRHTPYIIRTHTQSGRQPCALALLRRPHAPPANSTTAATAAEARKLPPSSHPPTVHRL